MATTNHERVGKALDLLREGLAPFVDREIKTLSPDDVRTLVARLALDEWYVTDRPLLDWDVALLLRLMWDSWNDVFRRTLGHAERSLASELRDHRNRWAHQERFTTDDTYRALDSAERLLTAISAPEASKVARLKEELLRLRYEEQVRNERRKNGGTAVESVATGNLKAWREVITPHKDVASGRYAQAEFAADLWQVHLGEGPSEYRDPVEFFRRTYLTESLRRLLVNGIRRLAYGDGDPVVQLQTNFGGGKTHSMLGLYHLFSGVSPLSLTGADGILAEAGVKELPSVRRVVLVGNKMSPGNPTRKPDGTVVRTFWGELAYQLGGREAYDRAAADDERATSPGDVLRELFNDYGPCLVLIDEWVAYARQLHDDATLPGGTFETQFSFAQALTESAKLSSNCLLVMSLPASDTGGSPHARVDDIEVGGQRGREALHRLRNVIGRIESSWRPASAEESFEIVRRRLFEPLTDPAQFRDRDVVARAFADLYRQYHPDFPPECAEADYERRIQAAYPIHPEVFDRLYTDWSALASFQRTRGVLRLMAAVIHSLWEKGDRNPLIMPANIPIDDPQVQFELSRYLSDNWVPVIERDVDGANSLPVQIDREASTLGKYSASRRVARSIYLGSAPITTAAHRGLEDRRINLGCVMPGESPAVFGDALRRLAAAGTYLYQDGTRYWYSTQPTVTKLAEDRAEQLTRNPDEVTKHIAERLRDDLHQRGDFNRIHLLPEASDDVPDDVEARLVVLGPDYPYSKEPDNAGVVMARRILETRGSLPRIYRNTLVFLAVDRSREQDLDEATRRLLAWESILRDQEALNLDPQQVKQARIQRDNADTVVAARLPEAYQWLLVPEQKTPQGEVTWEALRLAGHDPLAVRASRKLRGEELLLTRFAASRLRMELDRVPLWRGDHVPVQQLVEDFARYVYLPRLQSPSVLIRAVQDGVGLLSWDLDSFAFADDFDEAAERYRGLRVMEHIPLADDGTSGLLVKPERAKQQIEAESGRSLDTGEVGGPRQPGQVGEGSTEIAGGSPSPVAPGGGPRGPGAGTGEPLRIMPKRFHGTVELDPTRVGRDAGRIAEEVISHLAGLVGAEVKVTLEIEAAIELGVPEHIVRTVTENSQTLKFTGHGFEKE